EVLGVTHHAAVPRAAESNEGPSDPATVNESTDNNKKRRRLGYSLIPFLILGAVVFAVWRQAKGPATATLTHMDEGAVDAVAFSPDGSLLATGAEIWNPFPQNGPTDVKIWDLASRTVRHTLSGAAPSRALDAQRAAGRAYVKSQASLGWTCLSIRY